MDKHGRRNGYSDTVAFFWKIEVEAARYAAAREVGDFEIVMVRAGEGCPTFIEALARQRRVESYAPYLVPPAPVFAAYSIRVAHCGGADFRSQNGSP